MQNKGCYSKHRGFSLLEVLIAVVVLSIGLLGIAGLQLSALRFTHNAELIYQAALQANDMVERIRANSVGMQNGDYNSISGTTSDPGCIETNCTTSQMAQTDHYQWAKANEALLPEGVGTVVGNGTNFTITVNWIELEMAGPVTHSYELVIQP